jgi:hypothetical protein
MKISNRQIVEVVGVVAVVLSLLLVAFEVRQSNMQSRALIQYELLNDYSMMDQAIFENEAAASLLLKVRSEDVQLSQLEYERVRSFAFRYMNIWGAQEQAYRNGQMRDEQYQVLLTEVPNFVKEYPGMAPIFRDVLNFNPAVNYYEFVQLLDRALKERGI